MSVRALPRWEERLRVLAELPRDDDQIALTPLTLTRARQVVYLLRDAGGDSSTLRFFLADDGRLQIRRREGRRIRTLEVDDSGWTLYENDLNSRTSSSRVVGRAEAAAEALATL